MADEESTAWADGLTAHAPPSYKVLKGKGMYDGMPERHGRMGKAVHLVLQGDDQEAGDQDDDQETDAQGLVDSGAIRFAYIPTPHGVRSTQGTKKLDGEEVLYHPNLVLVCTLERRHLEAVVRVLPRVLPRNPSNW
jgi:hypothetical protein